MTRLRVCTSVAGRILALLAVLPPVAFAPAANAAPPDPSIDTGSGYLMAGTTVGCSPLGPLRSAVPLLKSHWALSSSARPGGQWRLLARRQ